MTQRFTSECELCAELLTDYISEANTMVETEERLKTRPPATAAQLASAMVDSALRRRNDARNRFFRHKKHAH